MTTLIYDLCQYVHYSDFLLKREKEQIILSLRSHSIETRKNIATSFILASTNCSFLLEDYTRHLFSSLVGFADEESSYYEDFKEYKEWASKKLTKALEQIKQIRD